MRTGRRAWIAAAAALTTGLAAVAATLGGTAALASSTACALAAPASAVKHVVYLQFDNTHYLRDRPDVASDLEQMPHLLNFLTENGTLFTNDHTILISHTGGGITSSLTGLYPDRNGITVSNSYGYFQHDGSVGFSSAFKYWTDVVDASSDPLPNMITDGQKTTPAPWVPFTRAGCDVGAAGIANVELENTSTNATGDMTTVFGAGSPEWNEAKADSHKAQADFVGIAVHCSQAASSKCAGNDDARPDLLPDEPDGYAGFQALFGAKYVDPAIAGGDPCVENTAGEQIADPAGNCGFPGFDGMLAKNTLGYVEQMQESGVPVTYGYISDAHDIHVPDPVADTYRSHAAGPGEADYEAQLKAYDDAFAAFFQNLAAHGIDRSNTLFLITVEEGDHFAGGIGTPQPDGTLAYTHEDCSDLSACPSNQIGEVNADLPGLLPAGEPSYAIHNDDAPTFYLDGNPGRTDPAVRKLERDLGALKLPDPYAGGAEVPATAAMADPVEEQALHMVNADPARTPTFTMFGNPDFFFTASGRTPSCGANPCVSPGFAWNHGDIQPEIATTWAGFVGPGIAQNGIDDQTWTDHTNLRPTMLALAGLKDDYLHDGRVLVEALDAQATPDALRSDRVRRLAEVYEQLNATFGSFGMDTLKASTVGLESSRPGTYERVERMIQAYTRRRDALATQIKQNLDAAAFDGKRLSLGQTLSETIRAQTLIRLASALAKST